MLSKALHDRDFAAIGDWFTFVFLSTGVAAVTLAGIAAGLNLGTVSGGFRILSLGLLLASASAICGWVLGLLFGVPRTLARPNDQTVPPDAEGGPATGRPVATSRVNTNLEDISDWLTKTIVGVGLTQLYKVPDRLWGVALLFDEHGFGWAPYGPLLALSLLLYFFPGGFWIGYVTTRTILSSLFDQFDSRQFSLLKQAGEPSQLRVDRKSGRFIAPSAQVAAADRSILQLPIQALNTENQVAAYAAAKARSNDLPTAAALFQQILSANPFNDIVKQQLAKVQMALGAKSQAVQTLSDVPVTDVNVMQALYDPPPDGFRRAIDIGLGLLARPDMAKKANLHVYMACAYGQAHAYALAVPNDSAETAEILVGKVVAQVREAVRLDPSTKGWLRSLWQPASPGGDDDDLASIPADNKDLVALLG